MALMAGLLRCLRGGTSEVLGRRKAMLCVEPLASRNRALLLPRARREGTWVALQQLCWLLRLTLQQLEMASKVQHRK